LTRTQTNGTSALPTRAGPDGAWGVVVTIGFCLLAAALLVAIVAATLIGHGAVLVEESVAMARLVRAYRVILIVGTVAGVATCIACGVLVVGDLARRRIRRAVPLTLTLVATAVASLPVARGAVTGADVWDMPLAADPAVQVASVAFALGGLLWACRCWLGQSAAAAAAERDLEQSLRRVTWLALGRSALTGCLSAWVAVIVICTADA